MKNLHTPVMIKEVLSFIPSNKNINVIDATFGGGGYTKEILKKSNVIELLAIDRDPISAQLAKDLETRNINFHLINEKFSKLDNIVSVSKINQKKFDIVIFDLGTSSNQIDTSDRGFSFKNDGPLDMGMGLNSVNAFNIVNKYDEKNLANIIYKYGEERYSRKIAKAIIRSRKIKFISNTLELSEIIKKCIPIKRQNLNKIHPATKTFQALRVYVNDELNEIKNAL